MSKKLEMIILPRKEFQITHGNRVLKEIYFGDVLDSTANPDSLTEWDATKVDYKIFDEVMVGALDTLYTAVVDNPVGHPSSSTQWWAEGINKRRFSDNIFTSQTVFDTVATIDFNVVAMNRLCSQNLGNVARVEVNKLSNGVIGELLTTIQLEDIESYDCESCCNPEPYYRTGFVLNLDEFLNCESDMEIRVTLIKAIDQNPVLVGTMTVGRAYEIGCLQRGYSLPLKVPVNIETFESLSSTGIRPSNIEEKIIGKINMSESYSKEVRKVFKRHGSYLNFYRLYDEESSELLLGKWTNFRPTNTSTGKVEVPIEIFAIEN